MSSPADSLPLDLNDFDAVGIASDVVMRVREHAITADRGATAIVSAPDSWHHMIITCAASGTLELQVRFEGLTRSRENNLSKALIQRDWQVEEDGDGARRRFRPGTTPIDIAFEALGVLTLAGAPSDIRTVTATDSDGTAIALAD